MSRSHAVRSGFSAVLRQPAVFVAELAWRWSYALAAALLIWYSAVLFLHSLPVTNRDAFGLSSLVPGLYGQALAHIFSGSGFKMVRILAVLAGGLSLLWWLAASIGRAATLQALSGGKGHGDRILTRVFALHALSLVTAWATAIASIGVITLAASSGGYGRRLAEAGHVEPVKFYLVLLPLLLLVGLAWSATSWYLSLAPVLAITEGSGVLDSIYRSAKLSRPQGSQFAWTGFVFGALRLIFLGVAFFTAFGLLNVAVQVPALGLGCLMLVVIAYSAGANFLRLARLAAYVRIIEWEREAPSPGVSSAASVEEPEPPSAPTLPQFEPPPAPAI